MRRGALEAGLEAWLDEEVAVVEACPVAVARRRRIVDRVLIATGVLIIGGVVAAMGVRPLLEAAVALGEVSLPILFVFAFTFGPLGVVLVVGLSIRSVHRLWRRARDQ